MIIVGSLGDPLPGRPFSAARRFGVVTTAAALVFATTSAAAFAQDDPTSTPPPSTSEQAPAPQQTGVTGVLYADKNRNGQQDPGEAISGGEITVAERKATSDANGRFGFADLAPGTYRPSYRLADGWVVHRTEADVITVVANQTAQVVARAERPYSEQLKATATLDRPSYQQPSTATIALSLTNTTDRAIYGIQAACGRDGSAHSLGRGWNVVKNLTLQAGETVKYTIYEQIPLAARGTGTVELDCDFAPNAALNTDGPSVHADAAVTGASSGFTMVFGQDKNADRHIDADEDIAFDRYTLVNARTGEKIERFDASPDPGRPGKVEFTDVPSGDYRIEPQGPWKFRDPGTELVSITEQGGFRYGFLVPSGPAKVVGTVKFDKPRYQSHETVRLELTVTNVGGEVAEQVQLLRDPDSLDIPAEQWGDFRPNGPGFRLAPGESRTFTVAGTIRYFGNGLLGFSGSAKFHASDGWHWGFDDIRGVVEVVMSTGDITGVVYIDRNRDGRQDAGEAAGGAAVEVKGGAPYGTFKTTTDPNGRFRFKDLPTGGYWIGYTLPDGWVVHLEGEVRKTKVEPNTVTQVVARAERPYRERLKATAVLDKATYAMNEEAQITITLTNTDDRPISGVKARCNELGHGDHLGGTGYYGPPSNWGDLRPAANGLTLAAGETKTYVVKETIPISARSSRRVFVNCDFAPNPDHNKDGAHAYDWAAIKGGLQTLKGWIAQDLNGSNWFNEGEGIPNTRIVLMTDRENGFPVAEAVSDAKGNVQFDNIPPGEYWAWIDGPWKFEGERDHVLVMDNNLHHPYFFQVVPDLTRSPRPAIDLSSNVPAGGGTKVALARTGASVLGLVFLGVLLVAAGAALRRGGSVAR
ncbi:SdrD B-like domain-containing protein [Lentzea rhizosphaerae]|uniref:SdrD B-like domain-containing protein n=1 Tax=Lentzea rhizosphaerae TaxID=2041025 RepID=A0ABV8CB46_9PSEU